MPQLALAGTIAVYVVLAVLLLSLNIFSLWRWWVKAAAILVTTACFIVAYFTITAMIGWPTFTPLPERFSVVGTRIVEPNVLTGAEGHVYLWVEEINEFNVPVTAPRGYALPYTPKLAQDTDDAQGMLNSGKKVMGETRRQSEEQQQSAEAQQTEGNQSRQQGRMGSARDPSQASGQAAASETIRDAVAITFSDMPGVALPDKIDEPEPPAGG